VSAPPVDRRDFPDPFVLPHSGVYLAFATNAGATNVQVMSSPDLARWRGEADALPAVAPWAVPGNTWAPAVLARDGSHVLYYTVREPRAGRQAISIAGSAHPAGPYLDQTTGPLVYQLDLGGSIDPSPFVDADGTPYLLWKADANAINQRSSLWIQRLTDAGTALVGEPVMLLEQDAEWEEPLIEAPSLVTQGGRYFLFYSANWWNTSRYAIGYATAERATGPYRKVTSSQPWFASDAEVAGPGGQECFVDRSGRLRMAYHGWTPGRVGYPDGARSMRLATINFFDGTPVAT